MTVRRQYELAFVRVVLFGSLLCSIGLGTVALAMGALQVKVLAALVVVTAASWFLVSFLHRRGRRIAWLVSIGFLNLLVVVPELALRVGGFTYAAGAEFGLFKSFGLFARDPELCWKSNPAHPDINSWGFRGPEIEADKPAGVFRIVYLGDSCTQWGRPEPYPPIVERRLNTAGATTESRRVECVSLAIAGYTAYQGRIVAEKYGTRLDPDLVIVWFGWNDHWLAYGRPDTEMAVDNAAGKEVLSDLYQSSRVLQFVNFAVLKSGLGGRPRDLRQMLGSELLDVPRVSPDQYRDNLLRIARIFDEIGVPVVFVTAPSAHRELGTPSHFVDSNYATDLDSVVAMHTQYVEIVREVARKSGQRLLDLESEWRKLPADKLRELFTLDGIHFEPAGCEFVAEQLTAFLKREFQL